LTIAIVPGTQTITFSAPAPTSLGSGNVNLVALASSGLTVTFTSLSTTVCTVSGSVATLLSTGTCIVSASQSGNANYLAATSVTQSFAVTAPLNLVTLSLGDTFGTTGKTVEVPIQMATSGSAAPATLQLDLAFDLAKLSYVANSARIGPRGTAAGKSLASSVQSNGALRLLVSGLNQNPITSGVVAYASFTFSAQFLSGTSVISPLNCSSVDGTAASITTACTAGNVRYATCDINLDGTANVADVQLIINEALGVIPAVHDLNSDGAVNVADVQIVINAALGLGCSVH
jgi:hypothetical protein